MSQSLQFLRTHRDITVAFIHLLSHQAFEKITVNNIIAEAMISRSTFYQHFKDKYDILESLQDNYISELTNHIESLSSNKHIDLDKIDQIMKEYFIKNRSVLQLLIKIKTEHVDIPTRIQQHFEDYFSASSVIPMSKLEANLLSAFVVNYFLYFLNHEQVEENFSTLFFDSFLKITIHFFRLKDDQTTYKDLIEFIKSHTNISPNK